MEQFIIYLSLRFKIFTDFHDVEGVKGLYKIK